MIKDKVGTCTVGSNGSRWIYPMYPLVAEYRIGVRFCVTLGGLVYLSLDRGKHGNASPRTTRSGLKSAWTGADNCKWFQQQAKILENRANYKHGSMSEQLSNPLRDLLPSSASANREADLGIRNVGNVVPSA